MTQDLVMIRDVISAEQKGKQQRYLQKVSHMLNQWQGGGRRQLRPSLLSDNLTAAEITLISLCVKENQTSSKN